MNDQKIEVNQEAFLRLLKIHEELFRACKSLLVAIECGKHEEGLNKSNPLCVDVLRKAITKTEGQSND